MLISRELTRTSLPHRWISMNAGLFFEDSLFECHRSPGGLVVHHPEQCQNQEVCAAHWCKANFDRIRALPGFQSQMDSLGYAEIQYGRNLILFDDQSRALSISIPSNVIEEISAAAMRVDCFYKGFIQLSPTPGTHIIPEQPPIDEETLRHRPLIRHPWVIDMINRAFYSESGEAVVHLSPCYYNGCSISEEDQAVVFEVAPKAATELSLGMTVWAYWYADDSIALVIKFQDQEFHVAAPAEHRQDILNHAIADFRLWELGREAFYPPQESGDPEVP